MLFDSFTIVAQIINFLILLWLLRRFLYQPILRVMDEREARIAAELAQAEQAKTQAQAEIARYEQLNRELQEQKEAFLLAAKTEADVWRQQAIARARSEIEEARAQWYALVRQEQRAFLQDLRLRTARQVYAIARKTLAELADVDLEQRIIQIFLGKIRSLDAAGQARMAQAIHQAGNLVTVRSAFPIPPEARQEISSLLHEIEADNATLVFEEAPELICGVEARIQSYKIAWTLDNYLAALEEEVLAALAEESEQTHHGEHTSTSDAPR